MFYVEAPNKIKMKWRYPAKYSQEEYRNHRYYRPALFLAGGITGCPNWQHELCTAIEDLDIIVLNPRRKDFNISDKNIIKQIEWENWHLNNADMISFWFPEESLCPIALYELGAWTHASKTIFVGIHPNYQRRKDVEIQTRIKAPSVPIVYSIRDLELTIRNNVKVEFGGNRTDMFFDMEDEE